MFEIWFAIVALLLVAYVVLDGFDFGAGAIHLWVARTDAERREVLSAIGPFWNGSEVCLLAAGGALFVAFPKVLASGLSGFYFAIFLVLWAIVGRGIALEFRSHVEHPLWRAALDAIFSFSSLLLPVLFGAALGNLLRGVPLDGNGWFSLPLFTDFSASAPVGILDWYTVLVGVFALVTLCAHGALFLAWKTGGAVRERSARLGSLLYAVIGLLWPVMALSTRQVNVDVFPRFAGRPLAWMFLVLALGGAATVLFAIQRSRYLTSFLGSAAFISGLSGAIASCLFPDMLRAMGTGASITAQSGGGDVSGLMTALTWFSVALPLAIGYFIAVFWTHRRPKGPIAAARP